MPGLLAVTLFSSVSPARSLFQEVPVPSRVVTIFSGYDVISVKPNKSGSGSMSIDVGPTTFRASNVSLKDMLGNAYDVRARLITGLPAWVESTRWDLNAKIVDPDPGLKDRKLTREQSQAEYRAECRSILEARFQLQAHEEEKIEPVYELVVAKDGPKFKETTAPDGKRGSMSTHNQDMVVTGIPLSSLAVTLSELLGRTVIDKTGLQGVYDFELKWTPDSKAVSEADNGAGDRPPGLLTALQEQLGLKLISAKGPVRMLVVDRIEMPSAD